MPPHHKTPNTRTSSQLTQKPSQLTENPSQLTENPSKSTKTASKSTKTALQSDPSLTQRSLETINKPLISHTAALDNIHSKDTIKFKSNPISKPQKRSRSQTESRSRSQSLLYCDDENNEVKNKNENEEDENEEDVNEEDENEEDENEEDLEYIENNEDLEYIEKTFKDNDDENDISRSHQRDQSASAFTQAADSMPGIDQSHIDMARALSYIGDTNQHAIHNGLFLSKLHQDILDGQISIRNELLDRIDSIKDEISNEVIEKVQEQLTSGEVPTDSATSHSHRVSGSNLSLPWKPNKPLKKLTYQFACQHVIKSNIEAYTALVRKPNKTTIENSLFRKIKKSLFQQGLPWCNKQLPPKPNGLTLTATTQTLVTMIKEKAKHARENLHTVLLTGIKPDRGCQECTRSIPDLQTLVGLIIQLGKEEIKSKLEGDIWKDTDMLSRTRFAYLRRECLRLYFPDKATSTIWIVVDNQLSYLLSKGRPYTTCFYNLIYQQDRKKFDSGSVMYDDIPIAERSFKLPSDDEVQAEIPNLQSHRPNKKANKNPSKKPMNKK